MDAERRRTKAVSTLLTVLEKLVRAMRMYPADHPKLEAFLDHAEEHFRTLLSWITPLCLKVDRYSLLFEDVIVYTNPDTSESLAFLLYRDGIRQIAFSDGITTTEVRELAAVFNLDMGDEDPEDDLATYLWEHEFQHIEIVVVEDYFEDYLPEVFRDPKNLEEGVRQALKVRPLDPGHIRDAILTIPGSGEKTSTIPLKETLLSIHQLSIDNGEAAHLKKLIAEDEEELYFDDMLEIVFTVIRQEEDTEHLQMYFSLFEKLFLLYLTDGPLEQALHLIVRLRKLAKHPEGLSSLLEEHIARFLAGMDSPHIIDALGSGLEGGKIASFDPLPDLLLAFPPESLPSLLGLFETVASMKARKVLCTGLARLGEENVDSLVAGISRQPWYVTRNIAYTLGLIGNAETVPHLGALIAHEDPRVRKEALRGLSVMGTPEANDWIFRGISHDDPETRMQSIRSLPKRRNDAFARELLELVETPGFAEKTFQEKEALYRLLGTFSTDAIIPKLQESLSTRRRFLSRARKEKRHFAAVAFAALGSRTALARLRASLPLLEERTRDLVEGCLARGECLTEEEDRP